MTFEPKKMESFIRFASARNNGFNPESILDKAVKTGREELKSHSKRLSEELFNRQTHAQQMLEELITEAEQIDLFEPSQNQLVKLSVTINELNQLCTNLSHNIEEEKRMLAQKQNELAKLRVSLQTMKQAADQETGFAHKQELIEFGNKVCTYISQKTSWKPNEY